MRAVNVKRLNYRGEVARRHRRAFIFKITSLIVGIVAVKAGLIYALFFSGFFDVRDIAFNGLNSVSSEEFNEKIEEKLNEKVWGFLPQKNNVLFVNVEDLEKEIGQAYPIFKSVSVERDLMHGLAFNFVERKPAGIWCFVDDCRYFDEDRVLWGQAAKSSGFIFLTVEDRRPLKEGEEKKIDDEFFKPIMKVTENVELIKNIVIPEDSFNEFRVYTAEGYYIIFATDVDIKSQLDVLKIFLEEKAKDSPTGFNPTYIDLRIDGRVYYK